jgi:hypothetical protein
MASWESAAVVMIVGVRAGGHRLATTHNRKEARGALTMQRSGKRHCVQFVSQHSAVLMVVQLLAMVLPTTLGAPAVGARVKGARWSMAYRSGLILASTSSVEERAS